MVAAISLCIGGLALGADGVRGVGDEWEVTAGELRLRVDRATAEIAAVTVSGATVSTGRGGVRLIDGHSARVLPPVTVERSALHGAELTLSWSLAAEGLAGAHVISAARGLILWRVSVRNQGDEQRWLEARLGLPVDPARGWSFWDGRNLPVEVAADARIVGAKSEPIIAPDACTALQSHYGLNFPAGAAWAGGTGLAVGLQPGDMHAYFAAGAEPGLSAGDALYYATRLVIDPGAEESAGFACAAFDPAWGERGAVERWHETWPEAYAPDPDGDPRVLEHCAVFGTQGLYQGAPLAWEHCRRLGLGWTWGTNARYAGLCFPEAGRSQTEKQAQQAYWSFTNPRYVHPSWVKDALEARGGLTPEEHIRFVREAFDATRDPLAIAADMTCQYLDKEVALAEFADAQLTRPNGSVVDIPNLAIMYAWGNDFGAIHARLVGEMLPALRPAGVFLDNAVGYDQHFGRGAEVSPGRAFSVQHQQLYSLEGIAQALQIAGAREYTQDGRRPYVAANTIGTYFGAAQCAVSLIESLAPFHDDEAPPWRGKYTLPGHEHYMALRALMGSKPIVFCGPYPWQIILTDEQNALPPAERDALWFAAYEAAMADYPLFAYRCGALSISYVLLPCANVRAHTATVQALARAGWRAVPGARASDAALWVERFGEAPGGWLTVGNPTEEPVTATVTLDAERLGCVALSAAEGAAVPVRVEGGTVRAEVSLPARTPVAWRMEARFEPPLPEGATVAAMRMADETRIEVDCPQGWAGTVAPAQGEARPGSLPAGRSTLTLSHPEQFVTDSAVADFPFLQGEAIGCAIVLAEGAGEAERAAAEHLARYFQCWSAHRREPKFHFDLLWQIADEALRIPVVTPAELPAVTAPIVLSAPEPPPGIINAPALDPERRGGAEVTTTTDGRPALLLRAASPGDLDGTLRALLARLDECYPY